jgi:hypothetical protein
MPLTTAHTALIRVAEDRQEPMALRLSALRNLANDPTVPTVTRESAADNLRRLS